MGGLNDFFSGTVAGLAGVVIEYPFDTVKVLLQSYGPERYRGYCDCACKVFREEGWKGFYRGVASRLVASGFEHAWVFASYKWVLRRIGADENRPSLTQIVIGGCGSGLASMLCLTPFELVKCQMQADMGHRAVHRYTGSWDCAQRIYRAGGIRALYQGGVATLAREVPGTIAWCGTYDRLKMAMTPPGENPKNLPAWKLMIAGGTSGVAFWTVMFPADVVKTRVQVDPSFRHCGLWKAMTRLYTEDGIRALYRGYTLTAIRSFPSNAMIFVVYDVCSRSIARFEEKQSIDTHAGSSVPISTALTATSVTLESVSSVPSTASRVLPVELGRRAQ